MAADPRTKLAKLISALMELEADYHQKRAAIHAEMNALVSGDDGIGVKLARLKARWCETWTARHHEKCDFDHKRDTAWLKAKLVAGFTEDEIGCKIQHYVITEDPYYVRARHPFSLFKTSFNTWRGIPAGVQPEQTIDALRELRGQ